MDYGDIAGTLGRTEDACRQLAARARQHVRQERPRFAPSDEHRQKLFAAFEAVLTGGDVASFAQLLAEDAVLYADGGGKRAAALEPIRGKRPIMELFSRVLAVNGFFRPEQLARASINGMPGFVVRTAEGVQTTAFAIEGDRIVALYTVRNPEKLTHLFS